jgi:nitroreductase
MAITGSVTEGIVNNDFSDVFLGRRCCRHLDPNYKVSREEIEQIVRQATYAAPSAVDSQPWRILVVDTDEAKQKLDNIMRIIDKDRVLSSSFSVVVFADRQWFPVWDRIIEQNKQIAPEEYPPEMLQFFVPLTTAWWDELNEGDGSYLDRSVNCQAGLLAMSFMFACRAHGLDTGVMDSWDPEMLADVFDVDLERYLPEFVIAVGKNAGANYVPFHYEPADIITWG